ncbi:hypothetical protein BTVI_13362 [Pitangus sulphuratus]|nr:hypothetical protein BTVI_13362 [Pitangus sulphuratus]
MRSWWGSTIPSARCHICMGNPRHEYRLGEEFFEIGSAEKDLGVLVDKKLEGDEALEQVAQRSCGRFILASIQGIAGEIPRQPDLAGGIHSWQDYWNYLTFKVPFNLSHSVIL